MSSYEPKPGQYDERLLAEAPQTTRAAKQEGYNVDLLNQPHPAGSSSSLQEPAAAPPVNPNRNTYTPPTTASDAPQPYTTRKTPWYRTTRGILILAIVALVIIGAVVGGAVGGTVGKHKNNNNLAVPGNSSSSASSSATSTASDNGGVGQGQGASSTAAGLGEGSASPTPSSSTTSGSAGAPGPASATSQSGTPAPSAAAGDGTDSATPQRRRSGRRV